MKRDSVWRVFWFGKLENWVDIVFSFLSFLRLREFSRGPMFWWKFKLVVIQKKKDTMIKNEKRKVIRSFRFHRCSDKRQTRYFRVSRVPTMASYKGRCRVPYLDPAKEQKGIEFQAFPPIHGYKPDGRLSPDSSSGNVVRCLTTSFFTSLAVRSYVSSRWTVYR